MFWANLALYGTGMIFVVMGTIFIKDALVPYNHEKKAHLSIGVGMEFIGLVFLVWALEPLIALGFFLVQRILG